MTKAIRRWVATREAAERRKRGFGTRVAAFRAEQEAAWWAEEADAAWRGE